MKEDGVSYTTVTYNALINAHGKSHNWQGALRLLKVAPPEAKIT